MKNERTLSQISIFDKFFIYQLFGKLISFGVGLGGSSPSNGWPTSKKYSSRPAADVLNYAHVVIQGPEADASVLTATLGAVVGRSDAWRLDLGFAFGVIGRNREAVTALSANVSRTF